MKRHPTSPVPEPLAVSHVVFSRAPWASVQEGLLGYVTFRVGRLQLDGVTLRRTRAGKLQLSYPRRGGRKDRFTVKPADEGMAQLIERQVIAAIGLDGGRAR